LIASLTPPNYDIEIIDENMDEIPEDRLPDIVGITSIFTSRERTFKIADRYMSKGVTVILGGSYPTFEQDDALKHCDAVIIGEAEEIWAECLKDWENGTLKRTYKRDTPYEFRTSPVPRWDLIDMNKINTVAVQTTRGCPYKCDFCLVSKMFGTKQRLRDTDDVINEIKSLPVKRIFIIDDNLTFDKEFAKELMRKLIPLGISWACQSSIDVTYDDELLDLMAEAGCISILIGLESVNPESLKDANKPHNRIEFYEQAVEQIHKRGMNVTTSFAIGFESDTLKTFDDIISFSDKNNISYTMLSILTAAPGTKIYDRMKNENRLLDINPEFFNGIFPNFRYNNIDPIAMINKFTESLEILFSSKTIYKKGVSLFEGGNFKRKLKENISFTAKILAVIQILKLYLFTKDKFKRDLFLKLFEFGRKKIASWDNLALYLLAMAGFGKFIVKYKNDIKYFENSYFKNQ
jgi:radical SAM superfamily enzyme YgiQ (UPF0313 family)